MPLQLRDIEARTAEAVRHYWRTLDAQAIRQTSRGADRGNRAAVTGGKQMDGFAQLVHQLLRENGVDGANIFLALQGFVWVRIPCNDGGQPVSCGRWVA